MILIAIVIAVIASLFWHSAISKFWISVFLSGLTSVTVFWFLTANHFGVPPDRAFFENFFGTLVMSSIVSIGVGKLVSTVKNTRVSERE
jgi:Na+/proline symporter